MTLTLGQVLTITMLLVIAGIGLRLAVSYFNNALKKAYLKKQWADKFFARCKPLLDDVETPAETLETLAFLTRMINDRQGAEALMHARGRVMSGSRGHQPLGDAEDAFFNKRPELVGPYLAAMTAALLAASYTSSGFDEAFRTRLAEIYGSVEATLGEVRSDLLRTEISCALREISKSLNTFALAPA